MDDDIPQDVRELAFHEAGAIIGAMCMTWDHSFGLMSPEERAGLMLSFKQVAMHDVAPAIARAIMADRERRPPHHEIRDLGEFVAERKGKE